MKMGGGSVIWAYPPVTAEKNAFLNFPIILKNTYCIGSIIKISRPKSLAILKGLGKFIPL